MTTNKDIIFGVPYTLPCDSHSAGIATRRVTRGFEQQALKYMPDYGGILEIPGSNIKQNGLGIGIPFTPKSRNIRVHTINEEYDSHIRSTYNHTPVADCLITTDIYQTNEDRFSTIRALGKNLYFDSIERVKIGDRPRAVQATDAMQYAHIPYAHDITGIEQSNSAKETVIVKFYQGVKLLKLNETFRLPSSESIDDDEVPNQSAFDFRGSFPSTHSMRVRDACMSTARNILGIASSNSTRVDVKLYDVARSKQFFKKIHRDLQDDRAICRAFAAKDQGDRKRSLRSFIPSKLCFENVQQLENDPHHMLNMTLTTTNRVELIDPRSDSINHLYMDRYKDRATNAFEKFHKMQFSLKNEYQFYLLSNAKLKAIDKRYLSQPVNSLEHMLDIKEIENLNVTVIDMNPSGHSLETVCMNANGQLCYISFDQSLDQADKNIGCLVNPKSVHAPLLEPTPDVVTSIINQELYGLSVSTSAISRDGRTLFSVLQLMRNGDLWIRSYKTQNEPIYCEPNLKSVVHDIDTYDYQDENIQVPRTDLVESRPPSKNREIDYINVLKEMNCAEVEERLTSKRAREKYQAMKNKLERSE